MCGGSASSSGHSVVGHFYFGTEKRNGDTDLLLDVLESFPENERRKHFYLCWIDVFFHLFFYYRWILGCTYWL